MQDCQVSVQENAAGPVLLSGRFTEHFHQPCLHGLGRFLAVVSFPKSLPQLPTCDRGSFHQFRLLADIGNHVFTYFHFRSMQHHRDTDLTGFTVAAAVAGCCTLTRYFGDSFDKIIEQKLFDCVGRSLSSGTAYTNSDRNFSPKCITGLMAKLKPSLNERISQGEKVVEGLAGILSAR